MLTFLPFPLSLRNEKNADEVDADFDADAGDRNRTDAKINRMVLLVANKVWQIKLLIACHLAVFFTCLSLLSAPSSTEHLGKLVKPKPVKLNVTL